MHSKFIIRALASILIILTSLTLASAELTAKEQLEQELKQLEIEIAEHKKLIDQKSKEGKSLERDITILDTKIKKSEAEIKARDKAIKNLNLSIQDKSSKIVILDKKITTGLDSISNTFRSMEFEKSKANNLVIAMFSEGTISGALTNLSNNEDLKTSLKNSVDNVKNTKRVMESVKAELEQGKKQELTLKTQQIEIKQEIEEDKTEKNTVLKETKGQEKLYQELVKANEKKAKEIRSKLFSFADGSQVNFGNLYEYAKLASAATGVRTEFILAILEQESALGVNVGQCYVTDNSGTLTTISSGQNRGSMKPDSITPFFNITSALGRDPFKTRVSCSLSYGYGGAMGISQFMPATWVGYESNIESATGATVADPWNPSHAIAGTSFLLRDNGAASSERDAACKYYSGRSCSRSSNAARYGDQVMARIQGIQNKIDVLKKS